jgi:hypothetical protein
MSKMELDKNKVNTNRNIFLPKIALKELVKAKKVFSSIIATLPTAPTKLWIESNAGLEFSSAICINL